MEKTYVFNQDGAGGTSNGLLASILPSLQNRGIDTGYLTVEAVTVVSSGTTAVFRTLLR